MDIAYLTLALALAGSIAGCLMAARVARPVWVGLPEEDRGKFFVVAALPSSQAFYGFIISLLMSSEALGFAAAVPLSYGCVLMIIALWKGRIAAKMVSAIEKDPACLGKRFVPIALLEGLSVLCLLQVILSV